MELSLCLPMPLTGLPCTPVLAISHAIHPMHRSLITFSGNEPNGAVDTILVRFLLDLGSALE